MFQYLFSTIDTDRTLHYTGKHDFCAKKTTSPYNYYKKRRLVVNYMILKINCQEEEVLVNKEVSEIVPMQITGKLAA